MDIAENKGCNSYLTKKYVEVIVSKHGQAEGETIEKYDIRNASDKMLGFLSDYWKLTVHLTPSKRVLHYFIKAISISNEAKAKMVTELDLFDKELFFYEVIKPNISVAGLKPWCAGFVTRLNNAIVFEDMNALEYKLRDKFKRFDMAHILEALKTLARFHASSIIYEEKKSGKLGHKYCLNDEFGHFLGDAGYVISNQWYLLCMEGALTALKTFSNYSDEQIKLIEGTWTDVWSSALTLSTLSPEYRNVVCHRDLWNNNIMFHYNKDGEPDDCVLVDFQAARYQPPSGDVMLFLCCNVDPTFRENNLNIFLNFYLQELHNILTDHEINPDIVNRKQFYKSAYEQRKWGLVICACLMPQFWFSDDEITRIFGDTDQFDDILSKNKASFIVKMMQANNDYKTKVMEIFKEIAERYCL